jgi:AmmeMemoRadiSam system protein A
MINSELQQILLKVARQSITDGCSRDIQPNIDYTKYPKELQQHRATFVTLHKNNNLRGCIGSLQPIRPLIEDVAINAYSSAFNDYRFSQVTEDELKQLVIDISILTPNKQLAVNSEAELLAKIRPNIDGLFITNTEYSATFLPSVWEELPDPKLFLAHLKQKAGMPADAWPQDMNCYVYQSEMIKEKNHTHDR